MKKMNSFEKPEILDLLKVKTTNLDVVIQNRFGEFSETVDTHHCVGVAKGDFIYLKDRETGYYFVTPLDRVAPRDRSCFTVPLELNREIHTESVGFLLEDINFLELENDVRDVMKPILDLVEHEVKILEDAIMADCWRHLGEGEKAAE